MTHTFPVIKNINCKNLLSDIMAFFNVNHILHIYLIWKLSIKYLIILDAWLESRLLLVVSAL